MTRSNSSLNAGGALRHRLALRCASHMKIFRHLAFIFLLSPFLTEAADRSSAAQIEELHGVYKFRFKNGLVTGESYQSEDIVEIVPFDDSHIYIRTHLEFANGHQCSIWGIAGYEGGTFVYREPENTSIRSPSCTLRISATKENLVLTDVDSTTGYSTCSAHCGARGSFYNFSIARSSKRKIRYLERLKASSQYLEAVDAFRAQSPTQRSSGTPQKRGAP